MACYMHYFRLSYRRETYQKSQRVVRHISRGIAKSMSAAVTENHRRPRRRHCGQHSGYRDMREVHHHPKSIHLQYDALKKFPSFDVFVVSIVRIVDFCFRPITVSGLRTQYSRGVFLNCGY